MYYKKYLEDMTKIYEKHGDWGKEKLEIVTKLCKYVEILEQKHDEAKNHVARQQYTETGIMSSLAFKDYLERVRGLYNDHFSPLIYKHVGIAKENNEYLMDLSNTICIHDLNCYIGAVKNVYDEETDLDIDAAMVIMDVFLQYMHQFLITGKFDEAPFVIRIPGEKYYNRTYEIRVKDKNMFRTAWRKK